MHADVMMDTGFLKPVFKDNTWNCFLDNINLISKLQLVFPRFSLVGIAAIFDKNIKYIVTNKVKLCIVKVF